MIFEVTGKESPSKGALVESPSKGALVAKVKVSALKMRKEVTMRVSSMWNVKHMKKLMFSLYRKPADSGSWGSVRTM